MLRMKIFLLVGTMMLLDMQGRAQFLPPVPPEKRGRSDAERQGTHDAANIRTEFWNYGMVGNYPTDPIGVDLSTFHSVEVPKGTGMNYSDGITPFVLAKIAQTNGQTSYIMETGFRERQGDSPRFNRKMRFEPRPGYFQADPTINRGRSPAMSNDPRTWPSTWPDRDSTWNNSWNGYFGKRPAADLESFTVMDDEYYDAWQYFPDSRDASRRGLGLRIEVRGFQWANPQAGNVIFWHYDITNESTTDYPAPGQPENIIFGLYMDSGVGGSAIGCDPVPESDDDNAYYDRSAGLNLVYTYDNYGHGRNLTSGCAPTGYLGYAYLETPGKPFDGTDNDQDGIRDEKRDAGPGQLIVGQSAIEAYVRSNYNFTTFEQFYGQLRNRPAYRAGRWWTGDEDMDWVADLNDLGADGVAGTGDIGEGDGTPTDGETNFDKTDINESDQIGLTGFKMNVIRRADGGPGENVVFFTDANRWPERLYEKFTHPNPTARFDSAVVANSNIGFLFASGPFTLKAGKTERFSLALAYGADLPELRNTVKVVQAIYNANYQFAVPPRMPTLKAEAGAGYVQLTWDDVAEKGVDPVTFANDFEGYRIYRSTDPDFRDVKVITTGRGTGTIGNGKPIAQFDLINGISGFSQQQVEGLAYYLGNESGITHSWRDTTVTNGQQYYYAVTSYDYGPTIVAANGNDAFTFYPSENSIAVSRTLRGGTILPINVASVRPNPKVLGYNPADASSVRKTAGDGVGTVELKVVLSAVVPDNHVMKITFNAEPDSIHAASYTLSDSTTGKILFNSANDFSGNGLGLEGAGILPVVKTAPTILIDSAGTGFLPGSRTDAKIRASYTFDVFPINFRREGFPGDLTVTFSNQIIDTAVTTFGDALPVKFSVTSTTSSGTRRLKCFFFDTNFDSTLSANAASAEEIQVLTGPDSLFFFQRVTWKLRLQVNADSIRTPTLGDVYKLKLIKPLGVADVFTFTTKREVVASDKAQRDFRGAPFVVPNPYVGAASFEPEPFGVQGRGDRRMEFRNLPLNCTIRIYTVRGELVQSLAQDGSTNGFVAWNLRTKDNLDAAPGLYIYHVDAGSFGSHIGKFAIIK